MHSAFQNHVCVLLKVERIYFKSVASTKTCFQGYWNFEPDADNIWCLWYGMALCMDVLEPKLAHVKKPRATWMCVKLFFLKYAAGQTAFPQRIVLSVPLGCALQSGLDLWILSTVLDYFLNVASNQNLSGWDIRDILQLRIKVSYFKNLGFMVVASTSYISMLVLWPS